MLVYRDNARERSGAELERELKRSIARSDGDGTGEAAFEALLRAGEIESALADLDGTSAPRTIAAAALTDGLAVRALAPHGERPPLDVAAPALPERLRLTTPEGYAYYGLDPRDYARMVDRLPVGWRAAAVVGIRSIGTSLGAVTRAALLRRQCDANRISVRPKGHPWDRSLVLEEHERAFVERERARNAEFVVVDEGPGLSGSTFLSVARALEREGVPASRITLLCSHTPDIERLTGSGAATAWRRYRSHAPQPPATSGSLDLSAGAWRARVFGTAELRSWPAVWPRVERIKRLSPDGRWLDKFEGIAPYRHDALERASTLATAGFAPQATALPGGFVRYPWVEGRPAAREDLARGACEQLATYCAFRTHAFRVSEADGEALDRMLHVNVLEASGVGLEGRLRLEQHTLVVPDARMQPYEWVVTPHGRCYKVDGHADGDAHLLPGPADICWDLAGAIVEWRMNSAQQAAFVQTFERMTGDRVGSRLPAYLVAYTALRVGQMTLALLGAPGEEGSRLQAAKTRYTRKLDRLLRQLQLRAR